MERVTFILHLSLALLVMSAGTIFAVAEGRTGIPAITIPVAVLSFILVDRAKILRLPTMLHNVLGIVAFGLAGLELTLSDIEAPLLSGGHLLSYLTCNFLLQPKGRSQFWWLAALSLLQVAVAAVLTYDPWFGLAMPVFLLLMLWTLSVYQLQRAAVQAEASRTGEVRTLTGSTDALWLGRSSSAPAVQIDDQHRWVTPRFVFSMVAGTGLSLLLAGAFFIFIPRVWPTTAPIFFDAGRPIGGAPSRTGFTSQISLGHVGEIQESPRVALEVRLFSKADQRPLPWGEWLSLFNGMPRLRGATQEVYVDGRWRRWDGVGESRLLFQDLPPLAPTQVQQEVRIFNDRSERDGDVVFACGLPMRCDPIGTSRRIELDVGGWMILSHGGRRRPAREVSYRMDVSSWDPWFPNWIGVLSPLLRQNPAGSRRYLWTATHLDPPLRAQLEEWLAGYTDVTGNANTPYDLSKRWEAWFIEGNEFSYSLSLAVQDASIDPVFDFLKNTRRGHCEYFASALALLLRVQGIPTRVVSGYKGGQIGEHGELIVRDLHAHLWVEAFLFDAPPNPATGQSGPRWVTLDPTPAARDVIVQTQEELSKSVWTQLRNGWSTAWSSSLRLNQYDQQALIYDPLREAAVSVWEETREMVSGGPGLNWRRLLTSPREWFSWQGGLIAFVLLLTLSGLVAGGRQIIQWWTRSLAAAAQRDPYSSPIPFYVRLEALLRRHGFVRSPDQTPREFVTSVAPALAARMPSNLQSAPRMLAERFYSARYGAESLSAGESAQADAQLDAIERELEADALRREPLSRG